VDTRNVSVPLVPTVPTLKLLLIVELVAPWASVTLLTDGEQLFATPVQLANTLNVIEPLEFQLVFCTVNPELPLLTPAASV